MTSLPAGQIASYSCWISAGWGGKKSTGCPMNSLYLPGSKGHPAPNHQRCRPLFTATQSVYSEVTTLFFQQLTQIHTQTFHMKVWFGTKAFFQKFQRLTVSPTLPYVGHWKGNQKAVYPTKWLLFSWFKTVSLQQENSAEWTRIKLYFHPLWFFLDSHLQGITLRLACCCSRVKQGSTMPRNGQGGYLNF